MITYIFRVTQKMKWGHRAVSGLWIAPMYSIEFIKIFPFISKKTTGNRFDSSKCDQIRKDFHASLAIHLVFFLLFIQLNNEVEYSYMFKIGTQEYQYHQCRIGIVTSLVQESNITVNEPINFWCQKQSISGQYRDINQSRAFFCLSVHQ